MRPTSLIFATALGLAWTSALVAEHGAPAASGKAYVDGSCSECEHDGKPSLRAKVRQRWHRFHSRYREAHRWPEPYNHMARASVRSMLDAQVTKGWTRETTLYDHHFEPGTNRLSSAGRRRLQYITQQVRPERRFVYVQAGTEPADTQDRLAEVRSEACAVIGAENCPPIAAVNHFSRGARADEMTRIRELWISSTPAPRIPRNGGGGGGGGISAGGGGSQ